jgi:hypothetical protein
MFCDPGEIRTLDPLIKSQLLYQLSYGVIIWECKVNIWLASGQIYFRVTPILF